MKGKMEYVLSFTFIMTIITNCTKLDNTNELYESYLGQKPPGMTPEMFAPGIVTTNEYEGTSGFLNGGTVFVFNRLTHQVRENTDWTYIPIFEMILKDGKWTKPDTVQFQNEHRDDNFTVAPDGNTLYFQSNRSVDGTGNLSEYSNIWKTIRDNNGWSEPEFLLTEDGKPIRGGYPSVTNDGTLYFMSSHRNGFGETDIYRSECLNGKYVEAENLGRTINSQYHDFDSFIASDESFLIFISERPAERGNIYITFRIEDDVWTEPINMVGVLNSENDISRPSVTPDGKYFFYCKHPEGRDDIYWVDAKIIEALKPDELK